MSDYLCLNSVESLQAMVVSFSLGMGPIPWLIMSEVTSWLEVRTKCCKNRKAKNLLNPTFYLLCLLFDKQILPVNIKGLAGSIATLANWFFSWLITMTANLLLAWSSGGFSSLSFFHFPFSLSLIRLGTIEHFFNGFLG